MNKLIFGVLMVTLLAGCNTKMCKPGGTCIAKGMAETNPGNIVASPPSIQEDINRFIERIIRYFKDAVGCYTAIVAPNVS